MAENAAKTNGATDETMVAIVEAIEKEHEALDALKMEHMRKCKVHRQSIASVLDDAKDKGLDKKSVKAVVRSRALERKSKRAREDLADIVLQDEYDKMRRALGDFADTPLGKAATAGDAANMNVVH